MDTVDALKDLEAGHREKKRQYIFNDEDPPVEHILSNMVNPKILKITEKRNAKDTADDGPRSSPFAPHSSSYSSNSDSDCQAY